MRKALVIIAIMAVSAVMYTGCKSTTTPAPTTEQPAVKAESYDCPMKCEGAKSDKPGKCPVCGMDLAKVE